MNDKESIIHNSLLHADKRRLQTKHHTEAAMLILPRRRTMNGKGQRTMSAQTLKVSHFTGLNTKYSRNKLQK